MSKQWTKKEADGLVEMRRILSDQLAACPQHPDGELDLAYSRCFQVYDLLCMFPVIGDRRMLRFLRRKQNNVKEAAKMFSAFLKWRDVNNVDDIRNQILYGGVDTPYKFPNGRKIIELAPQIVISPNAQDKQGQPLGMTFLHQVTSLVSLECFFVHDYSG
jgi:hypothetical protein